MAEGGFTPRRLRVERVARRTDAVWLFTLAASEGSRIDDLTFDPGQVAVLAIDGDCEAYMAIASPPDQRETLEFLVKRTGDAGERLCDLGRLADVELRGVVGRGFPVDSFAEKDLIFVAAGTAIAPVRAAISHAIQHRERFGRIVLVHGVRHPDDFAVDDELDHWREAGVHVLLTVTRPGDAAWAGPVGRVQALLENVVRDTLEPVAFVCGSDEMMDQTTELLESLGVPSDRILRNY
jgi:NAD(P)H-flavin reductase